MMGGLPVLTWLHVVMLMVMLKPSLSSLHNSINAIVHRRNFFTQQKVGFLIDTSQLSVDLPASHKTTPWTGTSIRGGDCNANSMTKDDDGEEYLDNFELEKLQRTKGVQPDFGGVVAGLFGNLRIPASLIAGASLGSAFGLPPKEGDDLVLGMVKRIYVVFMLGSLCSMLLTVLLSTLCMNDIALSPPKTADTTRDYIDRYYSLEWMLTRTNFLWGSVVFVIGSMLRGWVFLSCPVVGRGLLGIMGSFILIATSIVVQYCTQQTGRTPLQLMKRSLQLIWNKMKNDYLFAAGTSVWIVTLLYPIATIPHLTQSLMASDSTDWWGRRR